MVKNCCSRKLEFKNTSIEKYNVLHTGVREDEDTEAGPRYP